MTVLLMSIVLVGLLLAGAPVAVALGLAAITYFLIEGVPIEILPQTMFAGMDQFVLLAIPLFIIAGEVLNVGGMTGRLTDFASALVGRVRGGLAGVNVGTSMLFAGISGSAAADASAVGSVMIPMMDKAKYPRPFSVAVTAMSAIIGPIIPPSIVFIMYGVLAQASVVDLFLAGVVPGVLLGSAQLVTVLHISRRRGFPPGKATSMARVLKTGRHAAVAMGLPIIVIGGLLAGVFTATESAAMAVLYGVVVAGLGYRALRIRALGDLCVRAGVAVGDILIIIAASNALAWVLVREQVPQNLADAITAFTTSTIIFLLLVNLVTLVAGMFLDTFPALIVLTPILLPVAVEFGVDPIHLGVILTVNLMLGAVTPPVGIVLFIAAGVGRTKVEKVLPEMVPIFLVSLLVLGIVTYVPVISLGLPGLLQ